jgi:acyl-lipid Delta6-acetylenase / acyl-lipid (9-3)-desaturase
MLSQVTDPFFRRLLRVQHWIFFPVLLLARFSWAEQSITTVLKGQGMTARAALEERLTLALHYTWYLVLAVASVGPLRGVLYVLASQVVCGALLSFVFVQSHNGMEVYAGGKDFYSAQIVSTRDIHASLFNDWFTGGLNYQVREAGGGGRRAHQGFHLSPLTVLVQQSPEIATGPSITFIPSVCFSSQPSFASFHL